MHQPIHRLLLRTGAFLLPILLGSVFCPLAVWSQTNPGVPMRPRGMRVEIEVTIRDGSKEIISVPASVKLYLNGTPCGEGSTSNGRMVFLISDLGDFTVFVEAAGYKPGQKDAKVPEPDKVQVEVNLERDPSSSSTAGAGGNPILAPKAKEALDQGLQALRD